MRRKAVVTLRPYKFVWCVCWFALLWHSYGKGAAMIAVLMMVDLELTPRV